MIWKRRTVKEEIAKELSEKAGISEKDAQEIVNKLAHHLESKIVDLLATNEKFLNKIANNEKFLEFVAKKLDFNLTRRLILATGALGALTLGTGTAGAKLVLTDKFIEFNGRKFYQPPVGAYDAIVLKNDTYVWAEDRFGRKIAEGEAGVDDANIIQKAINSTTNNSLIKITGVYYINKDIKIENKHNVSILGQSIIKGNNNKIIIRAPSSYEDSMRNSIEKLHLYKVGISIQDSFNTLIRDVTIKNTKNAAVELFNINTYTEFTIIQNVYIDNCSIGLLFKQPSEGASFSYASTFLEHVAFELWGNQIGIYNQQGANPSGIATHVRFWIHDDNVKAILLEDFNNILFIKPIFECFITNPSNVYPIYYNTNRFIEFKGVIEPQFYGDFTLKVYNPKNYPLYNIIQPTLYHDYANIKIGLDNTYGPALEIKLPKVPKFIIEIYRTFQVGEIITIKIEVVYANGLTKSLEKKFNRPGTYELSSSDIIYLLPYFTNIVDKIKVYCKTNTSSTDVFVRVRFLIH